MSEKEQKLQELVQGDGQKLELENPVVNQTNENCQVFNGPINGCVFAMPGATVHQHVDKPEEKFPAADETEGQSTEPVLPAAGEECFRFVHPALSEGEAWKVHSEVKRLVSRQGIQDICLYLSRMRDEGRVLLPQSPSTAYQELVRMGMPSGEGFSEKTFQKYYKK